MFDQRFFALNEGGIMLTYRPRPIDTSHVEPTSAVFQLIERLAENAHGVWAAKRLAEG